MRRLACALFLLAASIASAKPRANVRIVTDEADAVLAILDARAAGRTVREADWQRVFRSEGYVRLQKREHSMGRQFENDAFRRFALSPELLAKRMKLRGALAQIRRADVSAIAQRAFAYLPPDATIEASIYPVIKPRENSFVFEGNAIFKYLEDEPQARFVETVAHELHHIGYASTCSSAEEPPSPRRAMHKWLSAFGEGYAVLAASGGLHGQPYAAFDPKVREAWKSGLANRDAEFARVESFFNEVLDERLKGNEVDKRAFEFFGIVGPWYTVGWRMAVTIEEELGRTALIDAFCHIETLLATYNRAAAAHEKRTGERLPRWSARLVE